ncbi:MAG: hypothetical protein SVQ76_00695 [Candidatus Nanohaloarchaea archaeon]|nr:hypothetical protein [Candidatus Nanohaloarchaea archaeon]
MKRILLLSLAVAVMAPAASATFIGSENITVDLGERDTVTVERHYRSITTEKLSYLVPAKYEPSGLSASDRNGSLECEVDDLAVGKELLCTPGKRSDYTVTITYNGDFSRKMNGGYAFGLSNQVFVPTRKVRVRAVLPEGFGVLESMEQPYTPSDARIGSEGRRIYIEWINRNVSLGDTLEYSVKYEELAVLEKIALRQITVLLAIAVLLLTAAVVYAWRRQREEKTIASVFPVLKEDEKEVLRYMIDNEGEVEQREMVSRMDYSKAKISRLVSDLEDRNLIEKEKQGRINVVKLAREVGDIETG